MPSLFYFYYWIGFQTRPPTIWNSLSNLSRGGRERDLVLRKERGLHSPSFLEIFVKYDENYCP